MVNEPPAHGLAPAPTGAAPERGEMRVGGSSGAGAGTGGMFPYPRGAVKLKAL